MPGKFTKKTSKKTKRVFKKKHVSKKRSPMRTLIRREIARMAEDKTNQAYVSDLTLASSKSTAAANASNVFSVSSVITSLVQGSGQGQRIGNQIRIKKLSFQGTIVALPTDATSNPNPQPVQVKMIIFGLRGQPLVLPQPFGANNIFQLGNAVTEFTSTLTDMWAPVNQDTYIVYAQKHFKLGNAIYENDGINANQFSANNDFKYNQNFKFDLTKHIGKIAKFNDNTAADLGKRLYVCFYYTAADGSILPTGRTMVGVQYMLSVRYEDM